MGNAVGDRVPLEEALLGGRPGGQRPGVPLGPPDRRPLEAGGEEHRLEKVAHLAGHAHQQGGVEEALELGAVLVAERLRLGVDDEQGTHPFGGGEGGAQRQEAPLRHAAQHRRLDAQMLHEAEHVVRQVPVGEGLGIDRLPPAAFVVGDDPPAGVDEGAHLRVPHLEAHGESVRQDDGGPVAAGVHVVEGLAVDVGEGHGGSCLVGRSVEGSP